MFLMILQVVRSFTEELVGRFRPMTVRLAASITRDEFQAEDIAQRENRISTPLRTSTGSPMRLQHCLRLCP